MLEVYSINVNAGANAPVPFNNTSLKKGCSATISGVNTIELNKCGVYKISVDASAEASTTLQLYKNGVAQEQAQSTGSSPSFTTLVQVSENNSNCPCNSATIIQVMNTVATTLTNVNCCITKVC